MTKKKEFQGSERELIDTLWNVNVFQIHHQY